jgi:xanthosine utilization system XapX-like protein
VDFPIDRIKRGASMIYFWGQRLFGKVDQVPGCFYVATRCYHFQFLPLLPRESYLVLEGTEKNGELLGVLNPQFLLLGRSRTEGKFRGYSIPLSVKSVAFAWARVLLVVAALAAYVVLLFSVLENPSVLSVVGLLGFLAGFALVYWLTYPISRASPSRAWRLARMAGIPEGVLSQHPYFSGHKPHKPPTTVCQGPQPSFSFTSTDLPPQGSSSPS